jgi:hypothetical protein
MQVETFSSVDNTTNTVANKGVSNRGCHVVSVTDPYSYYLLSRMDPLLFLPTSSSFGLTRLSELRSRPTTSQKIWYSRESNPDLWICSQEL